MPKPSIRAIQRLYAMSGNRCAFSGCTALIIEDSPGMAGINMGEICHIRASKAGGERYDPDQTDVERHGYENLILLCRRHHKLIDSDTIEFSVAKLLAMKQEHEQLAGRPESTADRFSAKRLLDAMDRITIPDNKGTVVIVGAGSNVSIRQPRSRVTMAPLAGTIGADRDMVRYTKYLAKQYNEFASWAPHRTEKFRPAVIYANITKEFGSKLELIPDDRFGSVCAYLQQRITRTRLGRMRNAEGHRCYASFDEFLDKGKQHH
ncbi:HNH endonuclease [Sphingobium fluviale]|uniref:HNH endonuclease n=1 Tax=Sphingobium fluviale TaxID=2506423 RepID=A0A4Q1KDG2_9SPHN|nr:HNH endonuclease [Sphingobium fluviale]MBA4173568.1 HNH endonuclease [Hyphomicrobium sp.]RXR24947.1 HNH endonuclease [Sphingobium fluviale]